VLNEIVLDKDFGVKLNESELPVNAPVQSACDILGLDPLYVANEGKLLVIADQTHASDILSIMKGREEGQNAAIIGEITSEFPGKAYIETEIGGTRILPLLIDEQLPRIC